MFEVCYKPHLFTYNCTVFLNEAYLLEYNNFESYSGLMEHIRSIRGILELLGHSCKIVIDKPLKDIHEAYVKYNNLESDITDELFEAQPDSSKQIFKKIMEL